MGKLLSGLGWAVAGLAGIGFFLPWLKTVPVTERPAHAARTAVAELSIEAERPWYKEFFALRAEERNQALEKPFQGVSGYELLEDLRHSKGHRRHTEADQLFFMNDDSVLAKGLLIYAIPAAALLAACFLALLRRPAWAVLVPLAGTGLIYWAVRSKINETYFDRLVDGVEIGMGLWLSLYALLLLSAFLSIHFIRTAVSK